MIRLLFATVAIAAIVIAGHSNNLAAGYEPDDNDNGQQLQEHQNWILPHTAIIIDVGHGGIDGGASSGDTLEKDINLAIAKKVYMLLRSQGIVAIMNRTNDYALSDDNRWHQSASRHRRDLSQRRQLTEEIGNELLISLHVNWTRNSAKHGPVVLHQQSGESALLAFCLQDALNRQQHTRFFPREGKPFYLLRRVDQPSVIVEMGFISNEKDRNMLTDPRSQQDVAEAIVSGIWQYKWISH
ncbi:N-acetylmuramoyl-L-alanine amidase [Paenibacillus sp. HB172176]|uniref:N-acetylmuramoyl-L-alanine amidase n=1 Tax=Paenibacillus sp. HB172176 TaxID=2493690 RepID=UPI00143C0EF9|nr:N-acetylmuramoyl-L-alanine amidase [Paenibacillus sp. HB172176]